MNVKWSLETNVDGIFLQTTGEALTAEEALSLSGSLTRASEVLRRITGKEVFPLENQSRKPKRPRVWKPREKKKRGII